MAIQSLSKMLGTKPPSGVDFNKKGTGHVQNVVKGNKIISLTRADSYGPAGTRTRARNMLPVADRPAVKYLRPRISPRGVTNNKYHRSF